MRKICLSGKLACLASRCLFHLTWTSVTVRWGGYLQGFAREGKIVGGIAVGILMEMSVKMSILHGVKAIRSSGLRYPIAHQQGHSLKAMRADLAGGALGPHVPRYPPQTTAG